MQKQCHGQVNTQKQLFFKELKGYYCAFRSKSMCKIF